MRHYYVLKSVNGSFTDFGTLIRAQTKDPLKENLPYLFEVNSVDFELGNWEVGVSTAIVFCDLLRCVICHVLEHSNCDQVVIDITSWIACVHVDSIKYSDEVLLA